jgi:hypothetical protein
MSRSSLRGRLKTSALVLPRVLNFQATLRNRGWLFLFSIKVKAHELKPFPPALAMIPSDEEALAAAEMIKICQKKGCFHGITALFLGIGTLWFYPPAAIIAVIALLIVFFLYGQQSQPHKGVLREFAATRNWYHQVQTGRRDYQIRAIFSIDDIFERMRSNDLSPIKSDSSEEVSSEPSPPSERMFRSNYRPVRTTTSIQPPNENDPFIPPAGWDPTLITPFVLHKATSISPARNDQAEPTAGELLPPVSQVRVTRRSSAHKSSEPVAKNVTDLSPAPEGRRKPRTNYAVVRSAKLREAAIAIHGRNCIACGKNFDEIYGAELAKGYIEVHHLSSIATGLRTTDPATDLVPLCSNCHKMADRLKPPPRTIDDLKKRLFPAG